MRNLPAGVARAGRTRSLPRRETAPRSCPRGPTPPGRLGDRPAPARRPLVDLPDDVGADLAGRSGPEGDPDARLVRARQRATRILPRTRGRERISGLATRRARDFLPSRDGDFRYSNRGGPRLADAWSGESRFSCEHPDIATRSSLRHHGRAGGCRHDRQRCSSLEASGPHHGCLRGIRRQPAGRRPRASHTGAGARRNRRRSDLYRSRLNTA